MARATTKRQKNRRTVRDLASRPRKNAAVKGGTYYPAFSGGVRVASGDITSAKATIVQQ
jgi:hypothetical protein